MTPMTPFARAIAENPHDPQIGLEFADWLENRGYVLLANLYRRMASGNWGFDLRPGYALSEVDPDAHNREGWKRLAEALHEAGKPFMGSAIDYILRPGIGTDEAGGIGTAYESQLWNNHHPWIHLGPYRALNTLYLNHAGIKTTLSPYGYRNDDLEHDQDTNYFFRILSRNKTDSDHEGHPLLGTFITATDGKGIIREADDIGSLTHARQHLGDTSFWAEEPERLSMKDRVKTAVRLARGM